ncbi:hypothetical protein, partial [Nonomuraea sp. KM90]|uniref:hypothetical protein n=1 Tax=Nonomuraea sp. KM90 TaxID=3457428 RepID=UPI003FCD9BEE
MTMAVRRGLTVAAALCALIAGATPALASPPDDRAGLTGASAPSTSVSITAEPNTVECVPGGATAADNTIAGQLNTMLTGKMRNAMNGYRVSCARAITQVVRNRNLDKRAAVIAVTTTIVETSIRNVTYGDLDSLGLFQQRASWGSAEQRLDPTYATNAFLNTMIQFYPNNSWMGGAIGNICQAVQRSAFPDRYEPEAMDAARIVDILWTGGAVRESSSAVVYNGELTFFGLGFNNRLDHWWVAPGSANKRDTW